MKKKEYTLFLLFTLFTIPLTRKKKEFFLTRKKKESPFLPVPHLTVPKKNERGNPFLPYRGTVKRVKRGKGDTPSFYE